LKYSSSSIHHHHQQATSNLKFQSRIDPTKKNTKVKTTFHPISITPTMATNPPPLRVLISGAGIAGPALALHLSRLPPPLKCEITIIERHPTLRSSGQQIDLRGQGLDAMRASGLEAAVRARTVDEPGMAVIHRRGGKVQAYFPANKSGKGAQAFTAEWEIMRGDLCEVLYEATVGLPGVKYVFGTSVEEFKHVKGGKAVQVRLSDGTEAEYDLLVGCDGLGSRIRRRMFSDGRPDGLRPVGMLAAFYTVPPQKGDPAYATIMPLPGGKHVLTRRDKPDCLRVYLGVHGDTAHAPELSRVLKSKASVAEKKEAWKKAFSADVDMRNTHQLQRYLDALDSPEADDFYTVEYAQVRIDNWSEGRVTLVGDAGYCPSPLTGFGTSLAMIGAYVLAGEIARACGKPQQQGETNDPWDNIPAALAAYETRLRPLVDYVQDVNFDRWIRLFLPKTAWAIGLINWVAWLICTLRIDRLVMLFGSDDRGPWKMPEYPELTPLKKA
jgi:2-polyprenyl-6-methoxyphenol hydroxylase-like FAD-dependent oxidoreductase